MGVGPVNERPPRIPTLPQRFVFTLVRKHGARTNTANGVSTDRCPECNAPLTDSAATACEFCGTQLSTGVVVVLGIRIFSNAASIRRHLFKA